MPFACLALLACAPEVSGRLSQWSAYVIYCLGCAGSDNNPCVGKHATMRVPQGPLAHVATPCQGVDAMHVDGKALCQLWICISIAVLVLQHFCGDHFICTSLVACEWLVILLALAQKASVERKHCSFFDVEGLWGIGEHIHVDVGAD